MSEKKRRVGGSASKKPRVSSAASYVESLRSKLHLGTSILVTLRALASACSKSEPVSASSSSKALAEDDQATNYIVVADGLRFCHLSACSRFKRKFELRGCWKKEDYEAMD
ncbi:hypothetical protein GUJ93_ZPchr0013g36626 [Zizania palustris]|uniref:Uncharacterized protein n=1 Tax=Zizania palustris TaxID=103762 RepID=A0A8J6C1H4_ZIZPA|nr:hypothetical protein GUJ93_ZPchr0013g36626 [Zizania palustris]